MSTVRLDLLRHLKAASARWATPLDYDPDTVEREICRLVRLGRPKAALVYFDKTVGNHGIEGLTNKSYTRDYLYSNTGETYDATLILYPDGCLRVGNWGDLAEAGYVSIWYTPDPDSLRDAEEPDVY